MVSSDGGSVDVAVDDHRRPDAVARDVQRAQVYFCAFSSSLVARGEAMIDGMDEEVFSRRCRMLCSLDVTAGDAGIYFS